MATLTIPDELFDSYVAALQSRGIVGDIESQVGGLLQAELRRMAAPGFDRDGLTGCGTRYLLEQDINRATWGANWQDHSLYERCFLCLDIENFKAFIDYNGFGPSDDVLRKLAAKLTADYSPASVYRFGGDEFIVDLGATKPKPLPHIPEITLKYTRVDVRVTRNQRRNHHANRWIIFHLDRGIVEACPEGHIITCADPPYFTQERPDR